MGKRGRVGVGYSESISFGTMSKMQIKIFVVKPSLTGTKSSYSYNRGAASNHWSQLNKSIIYAARRSFSIHSVSALLSNTCLDLHM